MLYLNHKEGRTKPQKTNKGSDRRCSGKDRRKEKIIKNININFENKTIEMTKAFANKARRYDSDEYKEMIRACKEFPTYKLVTKTPAKKGATAMRGLTYDFMEKYIKAHNADLLSEFYTLTGKDSNDDFAVSASYGEVRQWFLNQFDTFSRTRIDAILGKHAA